MPTFSCTLTVTLPATPEEVFEAMTSSKKILAWSGQRGKVERRVGGTVELFGGWVKGTVRSFVPARELSHTWLPSDWHESTPPSLVVYTLRKTESGTKVILSHAGFPTRKEMLSHRSGWREFVFGPLKEYCSKH